MNNTNSYQRLKYVSTINDDSLPEDTDPDYELNYIDIGNVNSQGEILTIAEFKFSDAPSRARRIVQKGDVIVSTVRTYLKAIASIDIDCNDLIVSTGFAVIRPKEKMLNQRYCKYAILDERFIDEIQKSSVGVSYPAINASDIGDIKLPIPSLTQQNKIVAYLDQEVAKIDTLIKKKIRLVELLEEKKKATISQAVTKGLNPNVKLKSSDIDWLGDIPEHWRLLQIKNTCTSINTGGTPNGYDVEIEESNKNVIDWFTPSDITTDFTYLKNAKRQLNLDIVDRSDIKFFSKNSVLLVGIGTIGKIGIPHEEYYTNQQINILEINKDNSNEYIGLLLSSNIEYVKSLANSATLPILNQQKLGEIKFYLPELEEQEQIVKYLQIIISDNHKIVTKIKNSIDLLKEKRTAIISAAINGEIKL